MPLRHYKYTRPINLCESSVEYCLEKRRIINIRKRQQQLYVRLPVSLVPYPNNDQCFYLLAKMCEKPHTTAIQPANTDWNHQTKSFPFALFVFFNSFFLSTQPMRRNSTLFRYKIEQKNGKLVAKKDLPIQTICKMATKRPKSFKEKWQNYANRTRNVEAKKGGEKNGLKN